MPKFTVDQSELSWIKDYLLQEHRYSMEQAVMKDKRIRNGGKLLFSRIMDLSSAIGYCWASNEYFAGYFNVEKRTIIRCLNGLENYGYIQRQVLHSKDRTLMRKIIIDTTTAKQTLIQQAYLDDTVSRLEEVNLNPQSIENVTSSVTQMSPIDSININNTSTSLTNSVPELLKEDTYVENVEKEKNRSINSMLREGIREVFNFWKEKTGHKKAKLDSARISKIKARLTDGFSTEELCRAVEGLCLSPYHMGENETKTKYDQINLVFRNCDKVEFFLGIYEAHKAAAANKPAARRAQVTECKFCSPNKKCMFHDPKSEYNLKRKGNYVKEESSGRTFGK